MIIVEIYFLNQTINDISAVIIAINNADKNFKKGCLSSSQSLKYLS